MTKQLLQEVPLIGLGEKTGSFSFYADFFHQMGVTFSPDVEAATAEQILPMVKSDLGIGFVPLDFLKKETMENLVILKMEPAIPPRNICIVKRKGISLSICAAELEQLLWRSNAENPASVSSTRDGGSSIAI